VTDVKGAAVQALKRDDTEAHARELSLPATASSPGPTAPSRGVGKVGRPLWQRLPKPYGLVTLVVFLVGWQFVSDVIVDNPLFLSSPTESARALWRAWESGLLGDDLQTSAREFVVGFFPSVAAGILLGILLGVSDRAKGYVDPALNAWYATPLIALIPLFIIWFGIGSTKTIVICALLAFVPCAINTDLGIRSTSRSLLEAGRSFGATRLTLFTKVRLPSALPHIITGVRLAIGRGLLGVVAGEFFGSRAGIGGRILLSSQSDRTDLLFAYVAVTAFFGVTLVGLMHWIERKVVPWRAAEEGT
jgi:NitT/TauT family transport system permease protein